MKPRIPRALPLLALPILALLCLAACGSVQPDRSGGAAAVPATEGGGAGPLEGSPLNARNLGSGPTTTNGQ
jgi:hypothetical protein